MESAWPNPNPIDGPAPALICSPSEGSRTRRDSICSFRHWPASAAISSTQTCSSLAPVLKNPRSRHRPVRSGSPGSSICRVSRQSLCLLSRSHALRAFVPQGGYAKRPFGSAAAGLPIVALPSSGGVIDLLSNRPGAWLAADVSADALADALLTALHVLHPAQRKPPLSASPYSPQAHLPARRA